jgi:ribosomal protein S18 acetylase RimI-like enzyme
MVEDPIDEMSAGGVAGVAVPLGHTSKGKPETKSQRRKRQKYNREKSYSLGENFHQDIIKEGWRELLSTITAGNIDHRKRLEIEYESTLDDIALYIDSSNKHINIYTYIPVGFNGSSAVIDVYNPPKLVGFIKSRLLSSKSNPCIPKTFHVKVSAVAKDFQGKGMGKLIYNILATVAKSKGAGITSDHNVSTSPSATRVWNSMDRNPNYTKRVTKAGNDKFDYNGSTPFDTEDDCKRPGMGEPAIDHSLEIIAGIDDQMEVMERRHKKYTSDAIRMNASAMRRKLKHSGSDTFDEVY